MATAVGAPMELPGSFGNTSCQVKDGAPLGSVGCKPATTRPSLDTEGDIGSADPVSGRLPLRVQEANRRGSDAERRGDALDGDRGARLAGQRCPAPERQGRRAATDGDELVAGLPVELSTASKLTAGEATC